jgi:hypothetical protein
VYLRRCYRQKDGKRHAYWALVESCRTARGPRQRVAAYLGELDRQGRLGVARAAQPDSAQQADLFRQEPGAEWVEVDLNGVRVERRRPFGGSWLGLLLLGHSSRAAGLFRVEVEAGAEGGAHLTWTKRDERREWMKLSEGCYLLPSNVTDWSGEELWRAYIQLTEAEEALRLHKGDLVMRPVWHQKEDRVQAHILVCFLAYVLWKTLGQRCQRAGLGDEPRKIFAELEQISLVDVVLPTRTGIAIRKRCVSRPNNHQAILLQRLGLEIPTRLDFADL